MKTIVIIIILIIIILCLSTYLDTNDKIDSTEHFTFSDVSNNLLFNNIAKKYTNNNTYKNITNLKLNGNLTVNENDLSNYIINLKYPVGSYYIQYPENNNNNHWETEDDLKKNKDQDLTFPKSKSPAVLFGGKWENLFKNEGVYFRTPGMVANDGRVNGFQLAAISDLNGMTSLSQTNLWNPGYGITESNVFSNVLLKERIGTDGLKKSDRIKQDFKKFGYALVAAISFAVCWINPAFIYVGIAAASSAAAVGAFILPYVAIAYGVPSVRKKINNAISGTVAQSKGMFASSSRGSDIGHKNKFESSSQSKISPSELRIRNRLIKVWKRVE